MFRENSFDAIINAVLQTAKIEKIFVLATTKSEAQTESIFIQSPIKKNKIEHHYILVLIEKKYQSIYRKVQEEIENLCARENPVTVIAMEMELFNEWLGAGHPFCVAVKTKGLCIYDEERIELAEQGFIKEDQLIQERIKNYEQGLLEMQRFIKANLLHEAAVAGLMHILKAKLGISFQTNDIDQLINYCSIVIKEMRFIFPYSGYDLHPSVEKIKVLLHTLYAPYQSAEMQEVCLK